MARLRARRGHRRARELYEWLAATFMQSRILVGYDDTIGDMANGLFGSVVAGLLMAWWQRTGHGLRAGP